MVYCFGKFSIPCATQIFKSFAEKMFKEIDCGGKKNSPVVWSRVNFPQIYLPKCAALEARIPKRREKELFMKYKVGDKVWIVSKRPQKNWNPYMDKYLGKTMTIIKSGINNRGVYYGKRAGRACKIH